jgi:transposase, IS30 family
MEPEKRRQLRAEKRHESRIKKQELGVRIRKVRKEFLWWLELLPVAVLLRELVLANCPANEDGKRHKKLSLQERQHIYLYRGRGMGVRAIARLLGRAPSTISRELKRNKPPGRLYGLDSWSRAKQANDLALERRRKARLGRVRLKSLVIQGMVYQGIKDGLTPEFISARLLMEHGISLSHEAIYCWIYEVERALIVFLPRKGKAYRRGGKRRSRTLPQPVAPKLSIEQRLVAANERREFGHWEVDCIVSKQSKTCLIVLQERLSRYFFVAKLPSCCVEEAQSTVVGFLSSLGREWVKSLTCDNGSENWGHEFISKELGIPVYFCHPYCSSERGGVLIAKR